MTISLGKRRGLTQCASSQGVFSIVALDQRRSLKKAFNPINPESVTYNELVSFKQHVISVLAPESSAVLLDPEYGAAQNLAQDNIPGTTGLILALEETGYSGKPESRISRILPGWSVRKAQILGANAIKLLAYYHPDSPFAADQRHLIEEVAATCNKHEMPFFLEPIIHSINPKQNTLSQSERQQTIVTVAQELSLLGPDILKLEFPADIQSETDETQWAKACKEVTEASAVPWVLLSAGVDYDIYLRQVIAACSAGASGVMAGRSIWKEAIGMDFYERDVFLKKTATQRIKNLKSVCDGLAKPWNVNYPHSAIGEGWYLNDNN
jgi:tagatose-1,6-bisphosphate aldolase